MSCSITWNFNATKFTAYCVFLCGAPVLPQEHYELVPHQFIHFPADTSVYDSSVYYQYTEFISKNNQHRLKDNDMRNKQVRTYALPGSDRCLVKLLDTYLSKLVPNSEHFYTCPLPKLQLMILSLGIQDKGLELILSNSFCLRFVVVQEMIPSTQTTH